MKKPVSPTSTTSTASTTGHTRRQLLKQTSFGLASVAFGPASNALAALAHSSNEPLTRQAAALTPLNRFPRMMQEFFVERVSASERAGLQRKAALKTKADAEDYVREVKAKIRACFGPLPARTPLNARTTGTLERDAYKIEKVIFESRPGLPVTANLYLPKGHGAKRLPGVIAPCGHLDAAKAADIYQSFAQGLARQGYVVLIYDPLGQGERLQYVNDKLQSTVGNGVLEHLYAGNQQLLVGENFSFWRAWDGMRALDYLLTRPEVDPQHIGVTGNSGGGTITTWLCGLDDRFTMAAPDCFITTVRRNLENELPQDIEQCVPGMLAAGLDEDDFIAAMAPKPVILIGQEKDFFDIRGTAEAYQRLKRLYTLLGKPDNIAMFTGPTYHGYMKENREAMYRWFNRATGISTATTEPALTLEKEATLHCTPNGQVAELKARTVFYFTAEKAQSLARQRRPLTGEALRQSVKTAIQLPTLNQEAPDARILQRIGNRNYPKPEFASYAIETEPGIHALSYCLTDEKLYSRPPQGKPRAILYVAHLSSDVELREERLIRELMQAEPNATLFTCDVRGIGESAPDTCGDYTFFKPYGNDYFYTFYSLLFNRPYVGQKTFDVLRVLTWLANFGYTDIHLASSGRGTLPATFAALLADNVKQVTLKHALTSFHDIATAPTYGWPLANFIPNVLAKFDLPDCYQALTTKALRQIEPWAQPAVTQF